MCAYACDTDTLPANIWKRVRPTWSRSRTDPLVTSPRHSSARRMFAFTSPMNAPNPLRANISETGLVLLINEQKGEKEEIRDEREFSWCCSFPWGFGCRGTERRLASWRAAAECSSSQSGRRSGAGFAAGSRSSCQTEAADLHG